MESKTQRINLRATKRQENVIRRAADATHRSMTDFVLEAASVEAERIMADRRWFELSDEQWVEFERLLDEPMPSNSKLARLASRTSPFSEQ
ncbi:type II toxin-antitoxin system TacA family antitoxin [Arthrobacter sp. H14]|uniref:type II toxin-antitoxin system TacA family antitoxin n=1 Tax=Arthrobacter sp. H14 TaxID=1312959 RepID=UPI000567BD19